MAERPLSELLEAAIERDRLEEQRKQEDARLHREAGLTLRSARNAAGISQTALASAANVDQSYVSKVETGQKGISSTQLRNFYEVLTAATPNPEGDADDQDH